MENPSSIDKKTKEALLKLALGYEYEEKEAILNKNGKAEKVKVIRRHVPPDYKAIEKVRKLMAHNKWGEEDESGKAT